MRAAVCTGFGEPLRIEELSLRAPLGEEVLVRVTACAICHSDVAYAEGAWGGTLPAVYGHEAAGVVEATGPDVTDLRPGDEVVVTLVRACGTCESCRAGRPALCEGPDPVGSRPGPVLSRPGGESIHQGMRTAAFAEMVGVHRSQVVKLQKGLEPELASLLACGVLTGVGAVLNTAAVTAGSVVAVLGTGGVGLNCVQGARLADASEVIAVDVVAEKLAAAGAFGATKTVDSSQTGAAHQVRDLTGGRGADYVFVAAGVPSLVEEGARMLRRGGTLVIVGIPPSGSSVALDPVEIADGSLRILGSKMGDSQPQVDIPRLFEAYEAGRLKLGELISGRFRLDEVNEAITSAKSGRQLRPVLLTDG